MMRWLSTGTDGWEGSEKRFETAQHSRHPFRDLGVDAFRRVQEVDTAACIIQRADIECTSIGWLPAQLLS